MQRTDKETHTNRSKALLRESMAIADIRQLESNPSSSVICEVLQSLEEKDELLSLIEILSLVKTVVPVYPSLKHESRDTLLRLISINFNFMAQLVTFTSTLPGKQTEKRIYQSLIAEVILKRNNCLFDYMKQCSDSKIKNNDLKSLLFGSKLFNVISSETDVVEYLRCLREDWRHALVEMSADDIRNRGNQLGEYLIAMFTLHPVVVRTVIIEEFFLASNDLFQLFKIIIINSRALNQHKLAKTLIFPFLDMHANMGNFKSVYSVLKELGVGHCMDATTLLQLKSLILKECTIRLMSSGALSTLLGLLLQKFALVDTNNDEKVCEIIVMILKYSSDTQLKWRIGTDSKFLDGVTTRLMHKEPLIRERTMFIAKIVSDGDLEYKSDFEICVPNLELSEDYAGINFHSLGISTTHVNNVTSLPLEKTHDIALSVDSDDDDNEEDQTNREIVFLKDLVIEFASLENNKKTRPLSLLKLTVRLIRQKKDFSSEVSYYGTTLLSSIACLNNNLEELHFEEWRINALVSILVVIPDKVAELLRIFFTSELSLQQKMSLLSSFGLSARELRGYDDKTIMKPNFDFPTSRLPWDKQGHKLIDNNQTTSGQELSMQKVIWKSKKLLNVDKTTVTKNNFRQYAGSFFYPLAHAWLDGINLGSFDQLFKSHYLMTLHIIYRCADPVHDYDTMTEIMNQIMIDATQ